MARTACICLFLVLVALAAPLAGQCETFTGEVRHGERWQRSFGDGLVFHLRPTAQAPPNPPGWTIEVRAAPDGAHDFVWVATPPYRFANPRHLDIGYGRTGREAVSWSPRSFSLVSSEQRRAALAGVVRFLLWHPPGMTETAYEAAYDSVQARWTEMLAEVGRGELRLTRAEVASPEEHPPNGRIEQIAYEVTLCPTGKPLGSPESAAGDSTEAAAVQEAAAPGRPIRGVAAIPLERVSRACLDLPAPPLPGALSDSIKHESCRVRESGTFARTGSTRWRWALYRRSRVYEPTPDIPERSLFLFPDTLREDELVLFAGPADGDWTRPVWHDRSDTQTWLLHPPRAAPLESGRTLMVHRRCLNGTGGCRDHPFLIGSDRRFEPLVPAYRDALAAVLPPEWGTYKGVFLEPEGPIARVPVYLPGDANCCPAFQGLMPLRLDGGRLVADSVRIEPDTTHAFGFWRIDPAASRFGPIDESTSEAQLRELVGASQLKRINVHLGEDFCTLGATVFPDAPWSFVVAWVDSTRSRPAFARVPAGGPAGAEDSPAYLSTPEGVRVGTPLEELVALDGQPLHFSGFGWEYGGRLDWPPDDGRLTLWLAHDRRRLQALADAGDTVWVDELFGDRTVTTDHPLAGQLGIRVVAMELDWRTTEVEHFCG